MDNFNQSTVEACEHESGMFADFICNIEQGDLESNPDGFCYQGPIPEVVEANMAS